MRVKQSIRSLIKLLTTTEQTIPLKRCDEWKAHLAVPAAEPVAAHGIVGKGTLLTAVGSTPRTLLRIREGLYCMCTEVFSLKIRNGLIRMYSQPESHSHIPLPAPHIRSHTLVGLTTTGKREETCNPSEICRFALIVCHTIKIKPHQEL